MPNRGAGGVSYRYGFNGKETENDVKGIGNEQDYGMRIYDPRLGRFLSVDPIMSEYPQLTPFQFASNRPIDGIDLDGLEFYPVNPVMDWLYKKYLEYKYGDPTGVKSITQGTLQQQKVDKKEMSYHNENVPASIQQKLDKYNNQKSTYNIAKGSSDFLLWNLETNFEVLSMVVPLEEGVNLTGKALSKSWAILFKKEAKEIEELAAKHLLSSESRALYRQGKISQALDRHYEDMVRWETGGRSEIILGREYDAVTETAIIQAKRSFTALEKPKNFLSKSTRTQIKQTILIAKSQKKEAQFWFKYGLHDEVRKYIESKGGKVFVGLNK